jgi:chloride channel 7
MNDRQKLLDLRPYIDCAPYTINEHASLQRTYRMFRTLGLRHLCVIDLHNKVSNYEIVFYIFIYVFTVVNR